MKQNITMKRNSLLFLTRAAAIAALYVVLSEIANLLGLCSGVIQCRLSEALTFLPAFLTEAMPGLFIGCLLTNILTGCAPLDIALGPVATLIGAVGTFLIGFAVRSILLRSSEKKASLSAADASASTFRRVLSGILRFLRYALLVAALALPPIVANAGIVPYVLRHAYGLEDGYGYLILTVGAGEVIACGILGGILLDALLRNAFTRNMLAGEPKNKAKNQPEEEALIAD